MASLALALALVALGVALVWAALEVALRVVLAWPLDAGFDGSIPREALAERQRRHGVKLANGAGWSHLGWIADPRRERYRVERCVDVPPRAGAGAGHGSDASARAGTAGEARWVVVASPRFGSCLVRSAGRHRVVAMPRDGVLARSAAWAAVAARAMRRTAADPSAPGPATRILGEVDAAPGPPISARFAPRIAGPWRTLFRPQRAGDYVNDHTLFRDRDGRWRLLGITGRGKGDYATEVRFAHAVCDAFPPDGEMQEEEPVAEHGELAWAPFVLEHAGRWHLWWSPHRLWHASSEDGVHWGERELALARPMHRFFRDASVLEVAPGQWLMYATGRGRCFSRVDRYQSFDLVEWQYAGPALRARWGSERNAPFASMETPSVVPFGGRFHLVFTLDNGTWLADALRLVLQLGPRAGYLDTRVIGADNPYDFGDYRGLARTPAAVARLQAHAPRLIRHPDDDRWWITTAGWPWASTLTRGEVALAPLVWRGAEGRGLERDTPRGDSDAAGARDGLEALDAHDTHDARGERAARADETSPAPRPR